MAIARTFALLHRVDAGLRRKLTAGGWLVLALLVACAAFGFNTRLSLVHELFGLAAALLAVAAAASRRFAPRVEASRQLPEFATAGVAFDYALRLASRDPRTFTALAAQDALVVRMPSVREFLDFRPVDDASRNFFDRVVGYKRWAALVRRKTGARLDWIAVGTLAAAGEARLTVRCLPTRRGVLRFEAVRLGQEEPLGLMRRLARLPLAQSLVVLPRTWPVAPLSLAGGRRLQPGGVAFAGRIGDAEEFMGLREYRSGDTPRRIDWKAWARTGKPVVKEYQDEFFVRHALVIDTFVAGDDRAFETAVSIAASHVAAPRSGESLLDLMFVERRAYTLTLGRNTGSVNELLRVLAIVEPSRDRPFDELAEAVLLHSSRVSGAVLVLLAWDEPRRKLVARLKGAGVPLRVWVVRMEAGEPLDPGPMGADARRLRLVTPATVEAELAKP